MPACPFVSLSPVDGWLVVGVDYRLVALRGGAAAIVVLTGLLAAGMRGELETGDGRDPMLAALEGSGCSRRR